MLSPSGSSPIERSSNRAMQLQRNQPERSGALQAGLVVKQAVQYPGLERGDAVA